MIKYPCSNMIPNKLFTGVFQKIRIKLTTLYKLLSVIMKGFSE